MTGHPPRKPRQLKLRRPDAEPNAPGYFEIVPARLPARLDRLNALTKAGVRGSPGIDEAQALLTATLMRARVRGELLDLTAMGGLLANLSNVNLRPVEGSAPALAVLTAAGLTPTAAIPGDLLERAPTVTLILAGDRGNAYAQAQVSWAHACTPPGGTLYLAGDKDKGFDRYVRQAAAAFGSGETIARDGGMRVAKLVRRPGPTPPQPEPERYEHEGLTIVGLPGVFSAGKADKATALLIRTVEALEMSGKAVLDLGCGAGLLGAWAAQRGALATLADADLSSVRSAQATLSANDLKGEVIHSDVDAALGERTFDVILSNPPFHVGRGVVLDVAAEFLNTARRRLNPGGAAYFVANDFLPYEKVLTGWADVTEAAREQGFKVLKVRRQD
ncbi:rRNA (guanine-N2)-methyltransferase [Deinococcus irradiatisoli]|uniref:rRNA (Guanine-N2)-methyltransferase n=1 Tax=Deinococcus irradiatisoli TaxID=2202254 RepID=A0A2Z3JEB4_9DEIO|nr:class I SAM-dependent methyltransferase [Deinococcus irradiatisoli]AWN23305.1 rRNA (guanine-N2)-methyltransferase [Deinococcus irradiatisoli]